MEQQSAIFAGLLGRLVGHVQEDPRRLLPSRITEPDALLWQPRPPFILKYSAPPRSRDMGIVSFSPLGGHRYIRENREGTRARP
jgi:hypothetical protein